MVTTRTDIPDDLDALATLGHELRTPLTAIIGFADAMRERAFGPLDARYVDSAETIHQAARHLLELIERLTGPGEGQRRRATARFDTAAVVNETIQLFRARAEASAVELSTCLAAGPLMVDTDQTELRQILINLIANAMAAVRWGGRVEVSAERAADDLVITVADNGPGLPSGVVDGVGLGLVRALCAAAGGAFEIANAAGGGVKAVARLPVVIGD